MAAILLAQALPKLTVASAGLNAMIGKPADPLATELLRARGLDLSHHRGTQITRTMCLESDIVLVMDGEQRQRVQHLYPQTCGRVFRIAEHVNLDVPDPYRRSVDVFQTALAILDKGIEHWLNLIQRL